MSQINSVRRTSRCQKSTSTLKRMNATALPRRAKLPRIVLELCLFLGQKMPVPTASRSTSLTDADE
jgi:hypothetical protein